MDTHAYVIEGGVPLRGNIALSGAKNAALKIPIAALMFDGPVELHHVPHNQDVHNLLHLITDIGGKASFTHTNTVLIDGTTITNNTINILYGSKIRTSFMFAAPLLYRFGEAHIPNPGGCRLGARPIDRIIQGMEALGITAHYSSETGYYSFSMEKKPRGTYTFPKSSHTGTEFLIMLGVLTDDLVTIHNAAMEPEVDDLIRFLNEGGAHIQREGHSIIMRGTHTLSRQDAHTIVSDRIEAVTYAVLGIATKGDVTISHIHAPLLQPFLDNVRAMDAGVEQVDETTWRFFHKDILKPVDIQTAPYPGFLTDWQPLMALLLTQAEGESIIHETVLENRFNYVSELQKLGADITFIEKQVSKPEELYQFNYDPAKHYHLVVRIRGPKKLHNGVLKMADIRAGATLAVAALVAEGTSIVNEAFHMERGYENFIDKTTALGGRITIG